MYISENGFRKPPRTVHGKQFGKTMLRVGGGGILKWDAWAESNRHLTDSHRLLVDICRVSCPLDYMRLCYIIDAPHCLTSGLGWVV